MMESKNCFFKRKWERQGNGSVGNRCDVPNESAHGPCGLPPVRPADVSCHPGERQAKAAAAESGCGSRDAKFDPPHVGSYKCKKAGGPSGPRSGAGQFSAPLDSTVDGAGFWAHGRPDLPENFRFWRLGFAAKPPFTAFYRFRDDGRGIKPQMDTGKHRCRNFPVFPDISTYFLLFPDNGGKN